MKRVYRRKVHKLLAKGCSEAEKRRTGQAASLPQLAGPGVPRRLSAAPGLPEP